MTLPKRINKTIRIIAINIHKNDAIGNLCCAIANIYRNTGYNTVLYARGHNDDGVVNDYASLFDECLPEDLIFYHHSIYDPYLEKVTQLPSKKIVYFHGITPPELLALHQPETAHECELGLKQLDFLNQFDVMCVNSRSTQSQLEDNVTLQLKPVVIPPLVRSQIKPQKINRNICDQSSKKTLLTVGRVVPHKKIEDCIQLLSEFMRIFPEAKVELKIAGVFPETGYKEKLLDLIKQLQLEEQIIFTDVLSDDELSEVYSSADCYICMSEHEGFGITLLEAMKADLPVLAYTQNSIGGVLGKSGCQIDSKNYDQASQLLHYLLFDKKHRDIILDQQKEQLAVLLEACDDTHYLNLVSTLLEKNNA